MVIQKKIGWPFRVFSIEVDDVMALFKEGDFEDNKALSPMFLLGYSCQRRASRRKAQEISQKNER